MNTKQRFLSLRLKYAARKCLFCPDQIKLEEIISHGTQQRVNLMPCLSVKVDKNIKIILCVFQKQSDSEYIEIIISEGRV